MLRPVFFVLLLASATSFAQSPGENRPRENSPTTAEAKVDAAEPLAPPVAEAEAAIVKSDWKAAEAKLEAWLTTHSSDGRALFDAGYVADAQNRLEDAANLYRRATLVDPRSLRHIFPWASCWRDRTTWPMRARNWLAATTLDPGEAGPALKARAWRALAEIDKPGPGKVGDATQASDDLLEALKLTPGNAGRYASRGQSRRIGRTG